MQLVSENKNVECAKNLMIQKSFSFELFGRVLCIFLLTPHHQTPHTPQNLTAPLADHLHPV